MGTGDIRASEVNIATGGYGTSILVVHQNPGSALLEDLELLPFISMVVGSLRKLLILGAFSAPEID